MDELALLRILHVTGAVLLLGNVTVTGFWATYLYRARVQVPFRPVARAILWTDLVFTALGGVMLTVSGILLAMRQGYRVAETPWLLKGIVALALSTLLWLVVLLPDQDRSRWRSDEIGEALDLLRPHVLAPGSPYLLEALIAAEHAVAPSPAETDWVRIAARYAELEQLTGFDEGPMVADWRDQFRARGIDVTTDVLRREAVATWQAYADHVADTGATVYNARGAGAV